MSILSIILIYGIILETIAIITLSIILTITKKNTKKNINTTNNKINVLKNQNIGLKKEINKLEIKNFNLNSAIETITGLKKENQELQNKLNSSEKKSKDILSANIKIQNQLKLAKQENLNLQAKYKLTNESLYQPKKLLTDFENKFYKKLCNAFEEEYKVQCQIGLATLTNPEEVGCHINDLHKYIDFGLFDKVTNKPIVMIELNDKTHELPYRFERDIFVRNVLEKINIPLVTFYSKYENTEEYIKEHILQRINKE